MRNHRSRAGLGLVVAALATVLTIAPAHAADAVPEESGQPPQPEAAVMTRVCEQNGALVVMNNFGGGSVAFTVLVNNEASGSVTVGPGAQANHLVPIVEGQTVRIQVTADGMAPVVATRTRDCDGEAVLGASEGPGGAEAQPQGATDPIDEVPAGTPPPVGPATAVAGATDAPEAATTAPASDPSAPAGTLPFTGTGALGWIALTGLLLVGAGAALTRRRPPAARAGAAPSSAAPRSRRA